MTIQASPPPLFRPRESIVFLSVYLLSLALCIAVPRALTFLPSSVALAGLIYLFIRHRALPRFDLKLTGFFAAFTVLACVSALWAPDSAYSFEKALKTALILFASVIPLMAALAIPNDTDFKNTFIKSAAILCAVAGGLIASEYSTDFYLARMLKGIEGTKWPAPIANGFLMNRSSVFLVLLSIPVLFMLRTGDIEARCKNILTALVMLGLAAMLWTTNSQTAQIAALLSLPLLALPAHEKKIRRILLCIVLALIVSLPFLIAPAQKAFLASDIYKDKNGFVMDASIPHRFEVWNFMAEQIMQAPIIGHGIESTRNLRAGYVMPHMKSDKVLHPHNATLQIWIEFGILGIALCGAFIAYLFYKMDKMPPILQRYNILLFIVLMGVLSIGYGLWQPWLIGMVQALVTTGLIAGRLNRLEEQA